MDEENRKIYFSGSQPQGEFNLEDILAEYRDDSPAPPKAEPDDLADRSRRIVLEHLEGDFVSAGFASLDDVIESAVAEEAAAEAAAAPAEEKIEFESLPVPEPEPEPEPAPEPEAEPEPEPEELTAEQEALIDALQQEAEPEAEQLSDDDGSAVYAAPLTESAEPDNGVEEEPDEPRRKAEKGGAKEKFLSPLVALMALIALRRGQRDGEEEKKAAAAVEEQPEPEPGKAARRCAALMQNLRFRGRIATGLSLVMIYLTYAAGSKLPLTGALKTNPAALSAMLLILLLSVMMTGLDVFTEGIMSLVRKTPGARSLVSVSCVCSVLDAFIMGLSKKHEMGLPFCAVSAVSLTFAIWGAYFGCSGQRTGYRVLTSSKKTYTVTGEKGLAAGEVALLKSRSGTRGFVRRSEGRDYGDRLFGVVTPILLVMALVLGALASLAHGAPGSFSTAFPC